MTWYDALGNGLSAYVQYRHYLKEIEMPKRDDKPPAALL
jgi:hypothetical protein